MALFIDGPPSNIEDLTDQDSGLLDVCRIQQIDAGKKLNLAYREVGVEIESMFEQQRSVYTPYCGHHRLSIGRIAITPPLNMWHTWHTLSLVYRDAYFDQLNDRFQAKWNEFRAMSESAKNRLRELGIGLVRDPLPRPASPALTPTPATETGGTFYFAVALRNAAGEHSASSSVETITLSDGNAVEVRLTGGSANAGGWDVYVGGNPKTCCKQNDGPLSLGDVWSFFPSNAVLNGPLPKAGQDPNFLQALPRLLPRG